MNKLKNIKVLEGLDNIVEDIKRFEDRLILRIRSKVIAVSTSDYNIIWQTPIPGITKTNLDTIDICDKTIVVLSFSEKTKEKYIYGIDIEGNILWETKTEYGPIENKSKIVYQDKLYYLGAKLNKRSLLSVDPKNGSIKLITDISHNLSILLLVNQSLLLAGPRGIYNFKNEELTQISSEFVLDTIYTNKALVLMFQGESDYKFSKLKATVNKNIELEEIANLYLDASNKDFMHPLLIDNKLIKIRGKFKGLEAYDIDNNRVLWQTPDEKLYIRKIINYDDKNILIKAETKDFESVLLFCSLENGELTKAIDFKYPATLFLIENQLFISGGGFSCIKLGIYM
ncbi:MAG: hypothetical protein N4A49_09630 [Marinifilaceae bacterium]|jgi:outer membrane protein assembly factor BamB|nr:hypothetical protein [Marinifilaceae bacterium]